MSVIPFNTMDVDQIPLWVQNDDPATPPTGKIYLYAKVISGENRPFMKLDDGSVVALYATETTVETTVYQIDDVPAITNGDIGKGMVVGAGPVWELGYATVDLITTFLPGYNISWAFANGTATPNLGQNVSFVGHRDRVDVTASRALLNSDMDKRLVCNSASAIALTIPPFGTGAGQATFNHNTELEIVRYGAGAVSYSLGAGVTVVKKSGAGTSITAQYGVMMLALMDLYTNTWLASGDI